MSRPTARARTGQDRPGLYQEITDKITAELEAGRVPWVQPWRTAAANAPLAMPKNASTERRYSGINVLILWGALIERGFAGQSWLTFRQALGLGANVRKGERGTTVVYADRFVPDDERKRAAETGEDAQAIPFLKRFTILYRSMRRSAGRGREGRVPATARHGRAGGREADRGDRSGFSHRWRAGLLQPIGRFRAGAASASLLRADQLAPHGLP